MLKFTHKLQYQFKTFVIFTLVQTKRLIFYKEPINGKVEYRGYELTVPSQKCRITAHIGMPQ